MTSHQIKVFVVSLMMLGFVFYFASGIILVYGIACGCLGVWIGIDIEK